jgi:hypothetical protein
MSRKNWDKIADEQFASLSRDIQEDWGELRELTANRS